jgi:hypothetical protein
MACLDLLSFLRLDLMQTVNRIESNRIEQNPTYYSAASERQNLVIELLYPGHSADWILSFPLSSKESSRSSLSLLLLLHTQNIVLFSTRDTVQYA